jgi:SAM-dependent methyltransferase
MPEDFVLRFGEHLVRGGDVLDVACGSGRHALTIARAGYRVTAMDRSAIALDELRAAAARERLPVSTVQADVERMSLLPDTVDGIVNVCFLYRALFAEYERALRPGGCLFFRTFTSENMDVLGHSKPGRRFLLEKGELKDAFPGLRTVFYSEGIEDGRAMATLVASKEPL